MVVLVDNAATAKNRGDRRCSEHRTKEASCPWRPMVRSKGGTFNGNWFDHTILTCLGLQKKTRLPKTGLDFSCCFVEGTGGFPNQGEGCGQTWWFLRLRLCGSWDVNFKRSPLSLLELCFAEPALCRCFNVYIYIYIIYLYLISLTLICVFISIFIHINTYIYLVNSLETWRQVTGRMSMGGAFKLLSAPAQKSTKTPTSKMSSFNWKHSPPTAIHGGPPYFPEKYELKETTHQTPNNPMKAATRAPSGLTMLLEQRPDQGLRSKRQTWGLNGREVSNEG